MSATSLDDVASARFWEPLPPQSDHQGSCKLNACRILFPSQVFAARQETKQEMFGKILLCDLAGSERLKKAMGDEDCVLIADGCEREGVRKHVLAEKGFLCFLKVLEGK